MRFTLNPTANNASSSTLEAIVTSIANSTTLNISVYGGTTDEILAIGTQLDVVANPKAEGSTFVADGVNEGTLNYNYTQNIIATK